MNIYVSNLSQKVSEEDLKKLFTEQGEVSSVKVITDKFTGYSRGFAFIEMPDDEAANQAISKLDNTALDGKNISVKVAKPREERTNSGSYPVRGSGGFKKY